MNDSSLVEVVHDVCQLEGVLQGFVGGKSSLKEGGRDS